MHVVRTEWFSFTVACCVAACLSVLLASGVQAEHLARPLQAAHTLDQSLQDELGTPEQTTPLVDDEIFLRRISLDLIGHLPTPDETTTFVLDPSPHKRAAMINQLLADPRFGENWARYWRDVMLYRRSDERALLASDSAVRYLSEQFNRGVRWDQIVTSFVTAEGSLGNDGTTALIASQWGEIPETAAEISRVFLGVQIQCAQCHDHPTDRWQREEFHQFAAFFPRIGVRAIRENGQRRGFEVYARNVPPNNKNATRNRKLEHYMPDLDDPAAQGTLMEPVFFVSGQSMELGPSDAARRSPVAQWLTSAENPWFARAYVNRIWAELLGEGFYEPIDDLGPDRTAWAPATLDYLSNDFVASGYDVKRLFRVILMSETYQRESRPRRISTERPFVASCPQRLRGDQLYDALASALDLEPENEPRSNRPKQAYQRSRTSARGQVNAVFGYDPSEPREEVQGSIPQALLMMNSPQLARAIDAKNPRAPLGQLMDAIVDDEQLVVELYLRCLGRQPSPTETTTCLEYINEVGDRAEACEDLIWALINSTEFLYRR